MGCFSVCCSMSKLSIKVGDKVIFIPLIPNENTSGFMYIYAQELFVPFCLPIVGTYDDYGGIENIEKNESTDILEDFFGIPIEGIMQILTSVRKDVYDSMSPISRYFLEDPDILDFHYPFEKVLKKIGFVECGLDAYGPIFKTDYCEVSKDSDKRYKIVFFSKEKYNYNFEILNPLINNLNSLTANESIIKIHNIITGEFPCVKNVEKQKILSELGGMFILYDFYEKFSKQENEAVKLAVIEESVDNYKKTTELLRQFLKEEVSMIEEKHALITGCYPLRVFDENKYFLQMYREYILNKNNAILKMFCKFHEFNIWMYRTNTMYTPMFQGSQSGDTEAELALHTLCCEILMKRKGENNE